MDTLKWILVSAIPALTGFVFGWVYKTVKHRYIKNPYSQEKNDKIGG